MGFCLTANGSSIDLRGGYGGFFNLRKNIALVFDKEFGEHYSTLPSDMDKMKEFDKKANQILSHSRFKDEDSDILDFLYASDCDGSISYKTCKKIYNLIKDVDFGGKIFTYAAYSDGKDYEKLKQLLKECYKKRRKLRWY